MGLHRRHGPATVAGLALVVGLAGCAGDGRDPGASQPRAGDGAANGGTVRILNEADFEHLDPQRNYSTDSENAGRLITRTLTMVSEVAGQPPRIVGDLARQWSAAAGNRTWTFTLKEGLRYEDGTAVTAQHVKYGVERSFSADLAEGSSYARQYLEGAQDYDGPYVDANNGGSGIGSIRTPDDTTIIFTLNQPVAEFPWMVSLPTFSPVPPGKDTRTDYDRRPLATGPYMIEDYVRGVRLTLVRNPHWDERTDPNRPARPDRFEFLFGQESVEVEQRLLADAAPDRTTMSQTVLRAASSTRITEPDVSGRVVRGPSHCVYYLAMNLQKPAMQNPLVRQALQYAVDKQGYRSASGGPLSGPVVSTVIPPGIAGHRPVDHYRAPDTGDPDKARALLSAAGKSGLTLTLAASDSESDGAAAVSMQSSLGRVGVDLAVNRIPDDRYYSTILKDADAPELMFASWCPDWPSPAAILPAVFGPDNLTAPERPGPDNLSRYHNPAVNTEMRRITTELTDPNEAAAAWAALNDTIMRDAPLVPLTTSGGIFVIGSNLTGAETTSTFGGQIDLLKIGVRANPQG